MKKTLVAIAALAAFGAQAQTTVTLSGNLDFAAASVGGSQIWANGSTVSTTVGTASTSVINIRAVEDLGAGMKVTAHYGLDPRTLSNDALSATNNTGVVTNAGSQACTAANNALAATATAACVLGTVSGQSNTPTGLSRDELFVGIESAFGNVRLGSPNSIGLNSFQVASPLGTGIGSGYTGAGTAGTITNSFVQTRYSRSVRWDSPVIAGFTAAALYAPGNDQVAQTTGVATTSFATGAITPTVPVAFLIPNARKATELGLRYDNGPLAVAYANVAQDVQTNATGYYAGGSNTKAVKTSANLLNVSYNLGATTLYAGWNNGDRLAPIGSAGGTATDTVASKGNRFAIKYTMGQIDLMASQTTQQALGVTAIAAGTPTSTASAYTTDTLKAKVTGLRADYNLSKTAAIYAGYEKYNTGAVYAASALTSTGDRTLTSIGLKKQF